MRKATTSIFAPPIFCSIRSPRPHGLPRRQKLGISGEPGGRVICEDSVQATHGRFLEAANADELMLELAGRSYRLSGESTFTRPSRKPEQRAHERSAVFHAAGASAER